MDKKEFDYTEGLSRIKGLPIFADSPIVAISLDPCYMVYDIFFDSDHIIRSNSIKAYQKQSHMPSFERLHDLLEEAGFIEIFCGKEIPDIPFAKKNINFQSVMVNPSMINPPKTSRHDEYVTELTLPETIFRQLPITGNGQSYDELLRINRLAAPMDRGFYNPKPNSQLASIVCHKGLNKHRIVGVQILKDGGAPIKSGLALFDLLIEKVKAAGIPGLSPSFRRIPIIFATTTCYQMGFADPRNVRYSWDLTVRNDLYIGDSLNLIDSTDEPINPITPYETAKAISRMPKKIYVLDNGEFRPIFDKKKKGR